MTDLPIYALRSIQSNPVEQNIFLLIRKIRAQNSSFTHFTEMFSLRQDSNLNDSHLGGFDCITFGAHEKGLSKLL